MKKLKVLLFAFMAMTSLTLTSCGDDDGDNGEAPLTGRWYFAKEGFGAAGQEILEDWDHTAGCTKDHIELLDEGVYKERIYWEECEEDATLGTWSRTGNNVTIVDGEDVQTVQIVTLTNDLLKVQRSESQSGQTVNYITVFTRN